MNESHLLREARQTVETTPSSLGNVGDDSDTRLVHDGINDVGDGRE